MERRLIDANALMKNIGKIPQLRGITYGRMKKAVEETPAIDAVEVDVVAEMLADLFGSECACNFNDIDEYLPNEACLDCPKDGDHKCWKRYINEWQKRREPEFCGWLLGRDMYKK